MRITIFLVPKSNQSLPFQLHFVRKLYNRLYVVKPVGFVTFDSRAEADTAKNALQVSFPFRFGLMLPDHKCIAFPVFASFAWNQCWLPWLACFHTRGSFPKTLFSFSSIFYNFILLLFV